MLRDNRFHYLSLCYHKEQTIPSSLIMRSQALTIKGISPTHLGRTPIAEFHGNWIVVEPSAHAAWLLIVP